MRFEFIRVLAVLAAFAFSPACGGGGSPPEDEDDAGSDAETDTAVTLPTPITVQGTVVDATGAAYPGVTVFVLGSAPVLTNGSGQFSVPNVTPPYDVYIARADAGGGTLYTDLTRADPFLDALFSPPSSVGSTITATLQAAGGSTFTSPNPAATRAAFHVTHTRGTMFRGASPGDPVAALSLEWTWGGASSLAGTLHAFQYTETSGVVTGYTGYGFTYFTGLEPSESQALGTVNMNPVTNRTLSGTVTAPQGYNVAMLQTAVTLIDGTDIQHSQSDSGTFSHVLPGLPGASGKVTVLALPTTPAGAAGIVATRSGITLPETSFTMTFPNVPLPHGIAPAAAATEVGAGTQMSWQEVPNAAYVLTFRTDDALDTPAFIHVVTARESIALPDFAPFGVPIPSHATYSWRLVALTEYPSTDALAVADVIRRVSRYEVTGILAVGATRTVTTR